MGALWRALAVHEAPWRKAPLEPFISNSLTKASEVRRRAFFKLMTFVVKVTN